MPSIDFDQMLSPTHMPIGFDYCDSQSIGLIATMSRRDEQDKNSGRQKKISSATGPKLLLTNMSAPQVRIHPELKSRSIFLSFLFLSPTHMPIEIGLVHKLKSRNRIR